MAALIEGLQVVDLTDLRGALAGRLLVDLEHPEAGAERHTGNAVRPANLAVRTAGPAPCLGEHTHEVLTELGLTGGEIDELVRTGVAT